MSVHVCPPEHKHAETGTCYVEHRCRCQDCKTGRAEYAYWRHHMHAAGKQLLVDATGSVRRLRALTALGWSQRAIAAHMGVTKEAVRHLFNQTVLQVPTTRKIAAVYDDLSMRVPETITRGQRGGVARAQEFARSQGWVPPLAWDDDTIDDPAAVPDIAGILEPVEPERFADRLDPAVIDEALRGRKPKLAPLERRSLVRTLWGREWSDVKIAQWIGGSARQVFRIRGELGLEAHEQSEMETAA